MRKKISAEWGISRAALSGELLPWNLHRFDLVAHNNPPVGQEWSDHSAKRGSIFRNVEPAANIEEIFDLSISGSATHRVKLTLKITIDPTSATDGPFLSFRRNNCGRFGHGATLACSSVSGDARVGL